MDVDIKEDILSNESKQPEKVPISFDDKTSVKNLLTNIAMNLGKNPQDVAETIQMFEMNLIDNVEDIKAVMDDE